MLLHCFVLFWFSKDSKTKSWRFSDGSVHLTTGTLTQVLSAVVGSHGTYCGLLIHWENKVLFMALLGQIHIFLNVPNLYWTSHWMKLCCATLGISKRTEYVFRMDSDRFVCTWILFRLFLSFLDTEKARYWVKRHKHYCSPKENWWEHSPILKYTVLYYTTVHIIMCRLNMLCCIFFKIALKGFWCQASTRIKSLAFRQVENSWMDALSLTIVHTYTFMFVSKSVIFFSFFFLIRAACSVHMTLKA